MKKTQRNTPSGTGRGATAAGVSRLDIEEIRTRKVVLVDSEGKTVGALIAAADAGMAGPVLALEGPRGRTIRLGFLADGSAAIGILVDGKPSFIAGVGPGGESLLLSPALEGRLGPMDEVLREIVRAVAPEALEKTTTTTTGCPV